MSSLTNKFNANDRPMASFSSAHFSDGSNSLTEHFGGKAFEPAAPSADVNLGVEMKF